MGRTRVPYTARSSRREAEPPGAACRTHRPLYLRHSQTARGNIRTTRPITSCLRASASPKPMPLMRSTISPSRVDPSDGFAYSFGKHSAKPRIVMLDRNHRLVDDLADLRRLRLRGDLRPARIRRHPVHVARLVFVAIFRIRFRVASRAVRAALRTRRRCTSGR